MTRKILVDTGYWIALLNERDQHHCVAQVLEESLDVHTLLVPWPTLYECVDTRLARREGGKARLRHFLSRPKTLLVDDAAYRRRSLDFTLGRPITPIASPIM